MRDNPEAVVIFAAGFGTRMGGLTHEIPKPLLHVAGRPLLEHTFSYIADIGPLRTVVNTHFQHEKIARYLKNFEIAISHEKKMLLETGGGLRLAKSLLKSSPVFTLNSDAIWTGLNPLAQLRAAWDPEKMDALLLLADPENAVEHAGNGDFFCGEDGLLTRGPGQIYTGAQIIRTEVLEQFSDAAFSLNRVWDIFENEQRLFGIEHCGQWCDVGTPQGIIEAEVMLAKASDV